MLKIENTEVFGWEAAIRGMRNPLNSWAKSDSYYGMVEDPSPINPDDWAYIILGDNDLSLMKRLSAAGNDHGKFLRMINVTFDLCAPRYMLTEFDTYKVGSVSNSCSTMHKIHAKEFELDDFSHEHLKGLYLKNLKSTIVMLNDARAEYLESKSKDDWWQMIQLLPQSYNQRRTVQLNYQVLKTMYFARRNHKLDEWHKFCDWALSLPYFKEVCVDVEE